MSEFTQLLQATLSNPDLSSANYQLKSLPKFIENHSLVFEKIGQNLKIYLKNIEITLVSRKTGYRDENEKFLDLSTLEEPPVRDEELLNETIGMLVTPERETEQEITAPITQEVKLPVYSRARGRPRIETKTCLDKSPDEQLSSILDDFLAKSQERVTEIKDEVHAVAQQENPPPVIPQSITPKDHGIFSLQCKINPRTCNHKMIFASNRMFINSVKQMKILFTNYFSSYYREPKVSITRKMPIPKHCQHILKVHNYDIDVKSSLPEFNECYKVTYLEKVIGQEEADNLKILCGQWEKNLTRKQYS